MCSHVVHCLIYEIFEKVFLRRYLFNLIEGFIHTGFIQNKYFGLILFFQMYA